MKRLYLMMGVLVLLLIPTGAVLADSHETVIEAGEVINNDVIVFDGDVVIESGAEVNGDVIVFNGDAELAGAVNGDVVLFNGDMEAGDAASISGDCVLLNGDLSGSAEAELSCTHVGANGFGAFINGIDGDVVVPPVPPVPPVPAVPAVPAADRHLLLRRHPPRYGEHTAEILAEAGFSSEEVDDLRGSGVVA